MKKKKLLSVAALALLITTCTSVSTFAATAKQTAFQSIVSNGLDGGKVFDGINVTADTHIGDYLTDKFISEANDVLSKYGVEITADNSYYAVQTKIALRIRTLDSETKTDALKDIKEFLNSKLMLFVNYNDAQLNEEINKYFNASSYGTLTIGRNSNNDKVVSLLEDTKRNVLVQVNSSNVYKASEKLNSVNTYEQLKALISSYYPEAENYFNTIK